MPKQTLGTDHPFYQLEFNKFVASNWLQHSRIVLISFMSNWLIKSDGLERFTFYPDCSFLPTFGEDIVIRVKFLFELRNS